MFGDSGMDFRLTCARTAMVGEAVGTSTRGTMKDSEIPPRVMCRTCCVDRWVVFEVNEERVV